MLAGLPHGPQFLGFARHYDHQRFDVIWVHLRAAPTQFDAELLALGERVIGLHAENRLQWLGTWLRLIWLMVRFRPHVVHAELYPSSLLALSAAWVTGVRVRLQTRHHSTNNLLYFPKAVRIDKLQTRLASHILTVSENVRQVMLTQEGAPADKISVLWNTFDMARFQDVPPDLVAALRQKYLPGGGGPVVGVIARWVELKGIIYVVQAFSQLLEQFPDARLLLTGAPGDASPEIEEKLKYTPSASIVRISFEPHVEALYRLMDVYVHVPIDPTVEAFGQTYVEALACGTPMVCTLSGIAPEFVQHEHNALVVPFRNSEAIYHAMRRILEDDALRRRLQTNGPAAVTGKFDLLPWVRQLEESYAGKNGVGSHPT